MSVLDRPRIATPTEVPSARDARWTVRRSVAVALLALCFAALLDAEALHDTAETQPFGWRRDVATAISDPLSSLSRAFRLTAPRQWLTDVLGRADEDAEPPVQPSPPSTSAPPAQSPNSTGSTTLPTTTTTTAPAGRRTPTASDPLRLIIAGDSMTEAAGPALLDASDATHVVEATHELRYSSGLTRPDYFDWPGRLRDLIAGRRAEALVVMFGANDAQGIRTASGVAGFGTDAWRAEYRARVDALMTLLEQEGRTVYWVGQPIMRSPEFDRRMQLVTSIYRDAAASRQGVRFIDIRSTFTASDGSYSAYLPGSGGGLVLMRRSDGIHLTAAGADRLTAVVMAALTSDWHLR